MGGRSSGTTIAEGVGNASGGCGAVRKFVRRASIVESRDSMVFSLESMIAR